VQRALCAIDELLAMLRPILQSLDDLGLDLPAISINEAIERLQLLRLKVQQANPSDMASLLAWDKIGQLQNGLPLLPPTNFG